MKWYGFSCYPVKNLINKDKKKFKIKLKKYAIFLKTSHNLNRYTTNLYVPSYWNFLIIKNLKNTTQFSCYIFAPDYFFVFPFINKFLGFNCNKDLKIISFQFFYKNNFTAIFWKIFKNLFFSFSQLFFRKLKFKGKGYYIYKNNRNTIALQMGYSHIIRLYSYFLNVKFITKTIILMFGLNKINLDNCGHSLIRLKPINIFTGRGIRFTRQIIYRKTGKVSSYR